MTDENSERDRLIRLEQSFSDSIPLIRDSLDEVIRNQHSLKDLVIELCEQSKKFPVIDQDMRVMKDELNQLVVRVERQETATFNLDNDFGKFVNDEFRSFKKDFKEVTQSMNRNNWTLSLVRFVVGSVFGGAIALLVALLAGGISL